MLTTSTCPTRNARNEEPVGVIALAFGLLVLRETPPSPAAKSFDTPGIGLLTAFLFLLVWGLIKSNEKESSSTLPCGRRPILAV